MKNLNTAINVSGTYLGTNNKQTNKQTDNPNTIIMPLYLSGQGHKRFFFINKGQGNNAIDFVSFERHSLVDNTCQMQSFYLSKFKSHVEG